MRNLKTIKKLISLAHCLLLLPVGVLVNELCSLGSPPMHSHVSLVERRKAGDLTLTPFTLQLEGQSISAELGRLVVREKRGNPNSNLIEIAFGRLKSTSTKPGATLVFLNGGPGQPSTSLARIPEFLKIFLKLRESGDVILLDIRGAGLSTPLLVHREAPPLPPNAFTDEETALRILKERARAAAEHFRGQGVDLSAYNTIEAADDIEDLRQALGAQKLDLLGFSYGTHLALSVIRRHGQRINRVVLIGTEGPNHTLKLPGTSQKRLAELSKLVAADPVIGKKVPSLTRLLKRILGKLGKEPLTLPITAAATNEKVKVIVSKFALQLIIEQDLGDTNDLPVFPALFYSIDQGDYSILKRFVEKRFTRRSGYPVLKDVMDLASGATRERQTQIKRESNACLLGNVMNFPYPDIGVAYGHPDLGDQFRSAIVTEVPTLFISGSLDANTPPFQADEVKTGFKRSIHLVVKNAGHESMLPNQLVQQTILDFLRGRDVSRVRIALPPLRFLPITNSLPTTNP
jgi:pimeloyl-ACP methyl ester carboxylesterase